jgi:hypothetical protein
MYISEFDSKTAASMEAALEHACRKLLRDQNDHATRRMIAESIIDCARSGSVSLEALTGAGVKTIDRLGLKRDA